MRVLRLPTATAGRKNFGSEYAWHMEAYDRLCVQSHSIRPPERMAGTPIRRLSHMERPAKDRRRTGLKTSRHRASGDAAGRPTDPDSRPMPTGDWHGIQNGFSKQGPGKSRLPMVSNPFPDRTFTRSTASILSGRSRRTLPARLRPFPPNYQGLPRVSTDGYGRSRSSDGRCVRPAGSSM